MSTGALLFMGLTWTLVLSLAGYCFGRVLFGGDRRGGRTSRGGSKGKPADRRRGR